ncbi:hypothetical protein JKF63_07527 [Porcisia hertigi]|uniref:NADH:flavin oxidoreductase/NADH oxidase N-terminal domain-containing protein n=1 Tax=Porcisia hertigi TaxID=2761500 RepID=A0A836INY1_9TRYP|nr:hypothetical protein JKF63_07527 [Porcisia hertigi]
MLKPLVIGEVSMANRFVMAPLTRCRADASHVPTDAMVKHYSDRASMGLIITEATQIQKGYSTFLHEGGIFGKEQIVGWRRVTDTVHEKGGLIFCQIHHGGRATVPSNLDEGLHIMAPSAVAITGHECKGFFTRDGKSQAYPVPHTMTLGEIAECVQLYATAARNAIDAGFDGVQVHGANGYLIDAFLKSSSNMRTDEYGGSIENRCRFLFEVLDAVIDAIGRERTALRISPLNTFNGQSDDNPEALTRYICSRLNPRRIAFLDVMRGDFFSDARGADKWAREEYDGVLFTGMGFEIDEAVATVESGAADAIVFGTKALANPDLVARAVAGAALNKPNPATFYTTGEQGYNDYPLIHTHTHTPPFYTHQRLLGRFGVFSHLCASFFFSGMSSTENRRVYAHLFRPCRVGCVTMKNRMGMAPLTRCRADDNHVPTPIMKEYYASRASMGMIITESIMVQRNYSGFAYEPGLYSAEQVAAWRTITEAVHARGGLITAQIYHPGRATTPANLTSDKVRPMGPSAAGIPPNAEKCIAQWSRDGRAQTYPQRIHAMSVPEIGAAVKFFTRAARNAMAAGFDAVEIHAGGGYLIDSFLRDAVNQRTDEYGGTIENRSRLLLEVVDAVAEVIQPDRVGVRLTPLDTFNGQMDRQPKELTMYVCKQLDARKIAFVDVVRGDPRTGRLGNADVWVRSSFGGAVLASQGYTSMVMAEQAIVDGTVDAVLFGTYAVSNPDLVWRVLTNRPLNLPDSSTFFTRGIKGYTDYPICEPYNFCAPHAMVDSRVLSKGGSTRDSLCQRARAASMPVKMPQYFTLSQPLLIGTVTMKNRLVMGPMPRQRCDKHQCPTALMKSYYARRASYGLIISDPCEVEPGYTTYVRGAAISTKAQVRAWREIVDAVHQRGGLMYCQLHHGGRATLPCNIADGRDKRVVGPTKQGVPADVPCPAAFVADRRCQPHYPTEVAELSTRDIERIVQLYVVAAKNAMLAGFDGVEIHAGGGYLIDQFLRECSNTRKDDYGGSPSDRCHLLDRVVDAVAAAVGRRRIGVRISPTDLSRGMKATDQGVVAETVAKHMAERRIAYLTVASGSDGNYYGPVPTPILKTIRAGFHGVVMCDDNTGLAEAERRVVTDLVQGVCFTLSAIANPDIMFRAIYGVALAQPDTNTLFTHDRHGYDTYPTYAEMRGEAQADQLYRSGVDGSRYASEVPNSCIPVFTNGDSISASAAAHGVAKGNEKIVSSPIAQRLTSAVNSTRQRAPSILAAQSTEDTRSSIAARTISTESDSGSRILIYRNSRLRRRLSYGTAVVG